VRRVPKALAGVLLLVIFAVLFAVVGIVDGVGHPGVPEGDVALVEGVPDGNVSEAALRRAVAQELPASGLGKMPARDSAKFEELQNKAMEEALNEIWVRGEAEEMGITATPKQVAEELARGKEQNFKTEAAFRKYLQANHFTRADLNERIKLQIFTTKIQEQISKDVPPPSKGEIGDYYETVKSSQYTTKPTRDVRVVVTEKKGDALKAKATLAKDNSPASWKKVAARYSTDPTSKAKGGLLEGIEPESLQGSLKEVILQGKKGEVIGPVKYRRNFFVIQVAKFNPEKLQTLDEVETQIKAQLEQEHQQKHVSEFIAGYQSKWNSRTFCAKGFEVKLCSNYPPAKLLEKTREPFEACYEANPKGGLPETGCPAPVAQAKPALPGSVSLLHPEGEQLPQRPQPAAKPQTK
jgi:parvulin-like peptidyl-prolyl isomerase